MPALDSNARRALRARAHALHPVVAIGHQGLTPPVLREIDAALRAHELIKVRVFSDDRKSREVLLEQVCATLGAAPVQHLGKILVLWRPDAEKHGVAAKGRQVGVRPRKATGAPARQASAHAQSRTPAGGGASRSEHRRGTRSASGGAPRGAGSGASQSAHGGASRGASGGASPGAISGGRRGASRAAHAPHGAGAARGHPDASILPASGSGSRRTPPAGVPRAAMPRRRRARG